MKRIFKQLFVGAGVALMLSTATQAQWSIGKPGTREAPKGQNRYAYLVMADPMPGREFDFNDGYQNMHMGDLVQLPGWTGAQRFRLVSVMPRTTQPLYRRGNLIIWDQEGDDLGKIQAESREAIAGGKSRLIPGFDYSADGPVNGTFQVIGPRVTRPDRKKPFIPDVSDNKTPRPNRYVELDFVEPKVGLNDAEFETALSKEINEVLALPGWMAAQRFRHAATPATSPPPRLPFTKYLVIWETEGINAQALQDARMAAVKAGQIKPLAINADSAQSSWWVTISPFIDKDDFLR
ncbi:MAG TPA: hypothetical protein VEU06_03800 [Micropepsaceae bacterium]|nr:hypothetical protein [Micropepsaceae bacterium]